MEEEKCSDREEGLMWRGGGRWKGWACAAAAASFGDNRVSRPTICARRRTAMWFHAIASKRASLHIKAVIINTLVTPLALQVSMRDGDSQLSDEKLSEVEPENHYMNSSRKRCARRWAKQKTMPGQLIPTYTVLNEEKSAALPSQTRRAAAPSAERRLRARPAEVNEYKTHAGRRMQNSLVKILHRQTDNGPLSRIVAGARAPAATRRPAVSGKYGHQEKESDLTVHSKVMSRAWRWASAAGARCPPSNDLSIGNTA
ncbi:hypothetical protein EVAR_33394_1 [Eumeta japonica]|uniref:Uncharacterized protein n=1 Tax=Eumeta variegata TaxID=151549 RepID=A0A4C1W4G0_EUMVA|nr:hypothetical protein EVAR_33394_1 [Eumeta japonica]